MEPEPEINPRSPNPNKLDLFKGKEVKIGMVVGVKDSKDNNFYYGQITDILGENRVRVAYLKENKDKKTVKDTRIVNLTDPREVRPEPTRFGGPLNKAKLSWEALYELENTYGALKSKRKKKKSKKSNSKKPTKRRKKKNKKQTKRRKKGGGKKTNII